MGELEQVLGEADVSVELHPSLRLLTTTDDAARELHALVRGYLGDLLEDLKIPVQIRLTVALAGEDVDPFFDETLFRMTINGCPCRLGLEGPRSPTTSLIELSRSVAKEACQNRELFLTVPLCEVLRDAGTSKTAGRDFADGSPEDYRDLLFQLVQRGSGINRATERLVAEPERSKCWGFRRFESAVASPEATGIRVYLGKAQYDRLVESNGPAGPITDGESLPQALETWDAGLFRELGIVLPTAAVLCDLNLSEPDFRIQLNDMRLPPVRGLHQGQLLVECPPEDLQQLAVAAEGFVHPITGNLCALVPNGAAVLERCRSFTTCGPAGFIVLILNREMRRNAGHFLTSEVVQCSLDLLRDRFPVLVDTVLDRFDILELTAVLRDLLHEEVSIRDCRSILESLLSIEGLGVAPAACDAAWCSRWVRSELKRQLVHRFSKGGATLAVHLLDSELEARVVESDRRLLAPEEQRRLLTSVLKAVENPSPGGPPAAILTSSAARRKFRQLVAKEFPSLGVLSYEELSPDMNIKPLGTLA
jgi:hypothetical protein